MSHQDESAGEAATALVDLFGSPGRAKMLEAFLSHDETTLTASEAAEYAGFSESTFSRHIQLFLELGIVEEARQIGKTTLYQVNKKSQLAAALANARYQLRKQVGEVNASSWAVEESTAEPEPYEPKTVSEAHQTVAAIVPQLITAEEAATRVDLASQLEDLAYDHPDAVVDMIPAITELLSDEQEEVVDRVIMTLCHVARHAPDAIDVSAIERHLEEVPGPIEVCLSQSDSESDQTPTSPVH